MAGMGGGGAGVTALLARRSWLLVRGQRGVNGAAGAAEAQVGGAAKMDAPFWRRPRAAWWLGGLWPIGFWAYACWRRLG